MKDLKGKKILVVEDDPVLREVLVCYFTMYDSHVSAAENGTIALEMLKTNQFDALLTDIRMSGGDGVTLIKAVAESTLVKPKVFVCSGFNDLTEEEVKKYEIVAVFEKPFDSNVLLSTISQALSIVRRPTVR